MEQEKSLHNNLRSFKEGEIIFMEHEVGDRFYFVQKGSVKITKIVKDVENVICIVAENDFFGEMAILDDAPRSATAIANEDSTLVELQKGNFEQLLATNSAMAMKFISMFAKRIINTERQLLIVQLDKPEFKVMDCLLFLAEKEGIPQDKYIKPQKIATTTLDIANWCAMKPEDTKKILLMLCKNKYISIDGGFVIVQSLKEMQKQIDTRRKKL